MKYRCVIADDSVLALDLLQMQLEKTGMVEIVAACKDGMEAYKAITEGEVDLVFTDVDMPYLNGLQLVKSLKQQPVFIFISSHGEYAVNGFELDVADFILKPVQMERLLRALEKAKTLLTLKQGTTASPSFSVAEVQDDHIFIRVSDGLVQLYYSSITYIESAGNFSRINTTTGETHLTLVSLKNLLVQLPEEWFVRVHRQYLVNIRQITNIDPASVRIMARVSIPLGAPFRQELLDRVAARTIQRNVS